MARRLRIQYSDAIYHVMARGNGRQDIVQEDADRGRLVACLERAVRRSGWLLYAYVLLTNHLHLVLKTPRPNLAKGMQLFLSSYANGWARRHRHCGHLFQRDIWGHPQFPLATGQTTPTLVHLTIMTLAGSMSDRAKASRADVEYPSMPRRNRAEVVVADEIGVYHCVQRVVRRAFLCGVDSLSGKSYDHRRAWIRDRLESLAGLFGVEIAAFAVMCA